MTVFFWLSSYPTYWMVSVVDVEDVVFDTLLEVSVQSKTSLLRTPSVPLRYVVASMLSGM